ncbi:MAG: hypothetical protein MMC33_003672 [Icmadophila ericetorum]|nr:hypothetical protein [Icmadophila ericetorum]
MQGGGHSPATHDHGLGADQLLEATVALANGQIVTADACQNSDLYFAIRGGGGGSYGVVVSAMIKAYPTTIVSAQLLAMAPLTGGDTLAFMEALAVIYAAYPDLSDGGFSGYGSWSIASPTPIFASYTIGMVHAIAIFNKSIGYAENLFAPIAEKLQPYRNTSLYISTTYSSFPTYDAYYNALSGANVPVSASFAGGSRLLDRPSLTANATALKQMLNVTAGTPDQYTSNNICLVGGGQVFADAKDPYSGVNPAWRTAYVHNIVARGWESPGTDAATITAIRDDITSVKVQAMKDLAPNTGCYMNEADRLDPEYEADFYGGHLARLEAIKEEYDSEGVFYCPTCIGSKNWIVEETGRLCPA